MFDLSTMPLAIYTTTGIDDLIELRELMEDEAQPKLAELATELRAVSERLVQAAGGTASGDGGDAPEDGSDAGDPAKDGADFAQVVSQQVLAQGQFLATVGAAREREEMDSPTVQPPAPKCGNAKGGARRGLTAAGLGAKHQARRRRRSRRKQHAQAFFSIKADVSKLKFDMELHPLKINK